MKTEPVKFEEVRVSEGWGVSVSVGGEAILVLVTQAGFGQAVATDLVTELERLVDGAVVSRGLKSPMAFQLDVSSGVVSVVVDGDRDGAILVS